MESFVSRYRNPLVLLAAVLVQLLGLAVQVRRPAGTDGHETTLARYWVVSAITPFERVLLWTGHGISHAWRNYADLRHVRMENEQLQAELNRMQMEQAILAENARQDLRLKQLLGFQQTYVSKTVVAHVLGTGGSEHARVLYLNKGSADGIRTDMPVITPDGVVGKIRDVFPHTSQVLEIDDPTSGLGVVLTQTRLRGILRATSAGQIQVIDVLPDERIQPGEPVVTSGGDNVYPPGLPVGVVDKVVSDPERNPYVAIRVRPAVKLSRLDEVLVITQLQNTMPTVMQQDIATSEQKAADVLAQRLPSVPAAATTGPDGKPIDANTPPPPVQPPPALHPDRFTPGATPPAANLTPGGSYSRQATQVLQPEAADAAGVTDTNSGNQPAKTKPEVKTPQPKPTQTPTGNQEPEN